MERILPVIAVLVVVWLTLVLGLIVLGRRGLGGTC